MKFGKNKLALIAGPIICIGIVGCNDIKPDARKIDIQTVANTFLSMRKLENGKKINPTKANLIKRLNKNASMGLAKGYKPDLRLSKGINDGTIQVNWDFTEETRTTWIVKETLDEKVNGWVVYLRKGGIQMTERMDKELFEIQFGKRGKKK